MISVTDDKGRNIWYEAARRCNIKLLEKLKDWTKGNAKEIYIINY